MVTVLLPTVARPELLRLALQSIAGQTAREKISRVVVSENAGDRGSEAVCRELPQLPISYILRDPPLSPLEHAQALMREEHATELIAILHDDDWWLPNHLEDAINALEACPDASAYGANRVMYQDGQLSDRRCEAVPWFAADFPAPAPFWRIASADLLLGSLLGLVMHYSTLVARAAALREAAFVYQLGNAFDNDRMILFALSRLGPVLFGTRFSAGIRLHTQRETSRFDAEQKNQRMGETTRWLIETAAEPWPRIAGNFVRRITRCPDKEIRIELLREATLRPWCLPEIARHLDRTREPDFFTIYDRLRASFPSRAPQPDR
jgi:hypothetical protein